MSFLKNNFMKIFMLTITFAGVCMFITLLANYDPGQYGVERQPSLGIDEGSDPNNALGFLFMYVSALVFFSAASIAIVMSMFKTTKRYNKWISFTAGILGLTFMLCSALLPLRSDSYTLMREIRSGERDLHIQQYVQSEAVLSAILESGDSDFLVLISMPLNEWSSFALAHAPDDYEDLMELRDIIIEETEIAIQTAKDRAGYDHLQNTIIRVTLLLVFGSLPMVYGLKLSLVKENTEGEEKNGIKE